MNPRFLHYVHQVYFKIGSVGRIKIIIQKGAIFMEKNNPNMVLGWLAVPIGADYE